MKMKKTYLRSLGLAAALSLGFCSTNDPPPVTPEEPGSEQGPDYGLDHDDIIGNIGDIYKDGRQVPPAEGQKLHSCGKLRYSTLGQIMSSRGINITNTAANSTGQLYTRAMNSWGVANFPGRIAESTRNTTSGLVNLQDIVLAMAEELITAANVDGTFTGTACAGAKLFNGTACDKDGFACLLGATPKADAMGLCDNMINDTSVTDVPTRKRLAVAALAGTIDMCD